MNEKRPLSASTRIRLLNDYFDYVRPYVSHWENDVFLTIYRLTKGNKLKNAVITTRIFAESLGVRNRAKILEALESLLGTGLICRKPCRRTFTYWINEDFENNDQFKSRHSKFEMADQEANATSIESLPAQTRNLLIIAEYLEGVGRVLQITPNVAERILRCDSEMLKHIISSIQQRKLAKTILSDGGWHIKLTGRGKVLARELQENIRR